MEVHDFESQLRTFFASDPLCHGVVLAGFGPTQVASRAASEADTSKEDWQLMLDFRVGESSQSWTLVHPCPSINRAGPPERPYRSFREALGVAVTSLTATGGKTAGVTGSGANRWGRDGPHPDPRPELILRDQPTCTNGFTISSGQRTGAAWQVFRVEAGNTAVQAGGHDHRVPE